MKRVNVGDQIAVDGHRAIVVSITEPTDMGPRMLSFIQVDNPNGETAWRGVVAETDVVAPPGNWQEGGADTIVQHSGVDYSGVDELIGLGLWPNPNQTSMVGWDAAANPIDDTYNEGLEQLCRRMQHHLRLAEQRGSEQAQLVHSHMGTIARLNRALQWIEDQDGDLLPARDMAMINYVLRGIEP